MEGGEAASYVIWCDGPVGSELCSLAYSGLCRGVDFCCQLSAEHSHLAAAHRVLVQLDALLHSAPYSAYPLPRILCIQLEIGKRRTSRHVLSDLRTRTIARFHLTLVESSYHKFAAPVVSVCLFLISQIEDPLRLDLSTYIRLVSS